MQNKPTALQGMISICAWCKRVREEGGSWQHLEGYIESHSKTVFTHGMCDDCLQKLDPADHLPIDKRPKSQTADSVRERNRSEIRALLRAEFNAKGQSRKQIEAEFLGITEEMLHFQRPMD
jgi:hypothetical protein